MNDQSDILALLAQLKERRVRGEITRDEYHEIREDILSDLTAADLSQLGLVPGATPSAAGTPNTPAAITQDSLAIGPTGQPGGGVETRLGGESSVVIEPGTVLFDQFRVLRELGRGGFGAVFEAEDVHLRERYAVKVLDPRMVSNPTLLERFRREVKLMRDLVHPHIVRVHDYREDLESGVALISMELVEGGCVNDLVRESKSMGLAVPEGTVAAILEQALSALAAAHASGVIHRDLSPSNLLISGADPSSFLTETATDPKIKLVDFGIAAMLERSQLSEKSRSMGTVTYLAPEMHDAEAPITPAVDIYSLGSVAYELLSGKAPMVTGHRPISEVRAGLAQRIARAIDISLSIDPRARPSSVELMGLLKGRFFSTSGTDSNGNLQVRPPDMRAGARVENGAPTGVVVEGSIGVEDRSNKPTAPTGSKRAGDVWIEPTLEMSFRYVPPGRFAMQHTSIQGDRVVEYSRGLWFAETPITQRQWEALMDGHNPSYFDEGEKTRPVERVSWFDAIKFCNQLSRMDGLEGCYMVHGDNVHLKPGATGFRLPTEAEWEYAAKAGKETARFAGAGLIQQVAWFSENSRDRTQPVGQKRANEFGVHDMSGNVWEWCWDWKGDLGPGEHLDPIGPKRGTERVLRGGSWCVDEKFCTCEYRSSAKPATKFGYIGFRIVRLGP